MFNKRNKKHGFTLIELIIVIAIIAILAAIAVPAFGQIRQKSNVSADLGNARTIYSVVTAGIADETIIVPEASVTAGKWYKLTQVGEDSTKSGYNLTDNEIAGVSTPKAYQGTDFYVHMDFDGNIKIAVSSTDLSTGTGATTPEVSEVRDSVFQYVYPAPTGRYNTGSN